MNISYLSPFTSKRDVSFQFRESHSETCSDIPGQDSKCSVLCLDFVTYVKQDLFTLKDRV